jgi:hypothetical protein
MLQDKNVYKIRKDPSKEDRAKYTELQQELLGKYDHILASFSAQRERSS